MQRCWQALWCDIVGKRSDATLLASSLIQHHWQALLSNIVGKRSHVTLLASNFHATLLTSALIQHCWQALSCNIVEKRSRPTLLASTLIQRRWQVLSSNIVGKGSHPHCWKGLSTLLTNAVNVISKRFQHCWQSTSNTLGANFVGLFKHWPGWCVVFGSGNNNVHQLSTTLNAGVFKLLKHVGLNTLRTFAQ